MKILTIPDMHLKPWMFDQAEDILRKKKADAAVCLMDMPDDFNKEFNIDLYRRTIERACRFAKDFPDTKWCWGNHELAYIWNFHVTGHCVYAAADVKTGLSKLEKIVNENGSAVKYVHVIDDVIFSHAGVTDSFVRWILMIENEVMGINTAYIDFEAVIERINQQKQMVMWQENSPVWARHTAHANGLYTDRLQESGHTPVKEEFKEGNMIYTDTFSTCVNGKPFGNRKFAVIDTKKKKFGQI